MHSPRRYRTFPVAVHLFFVCEGQVLLLRRCNTGYEDGKYSVPAGHIEGGESITHAAVREAKEEVGVDIAPSALAVVGVMHRQANDERVDFFLVPRIWTGEPTNCEPDKCEALAWFPLDALPLHTIPYVRRALENYQHGVWFEEFGWEAGGMVCGTPS
jgi:ADP-ribose pyrophosphatase YjhB (NUDIX family)